jgi:hypothetical protein
MRTSAPARDRSTVDPFDVNAVVRHVAFGRGLVTAVEPGRVTVAFDDVGYRVIDTGEAVARDLLRVAD